jgi:hypothetical protein
MKRIVLRATTTFKKYWCHMCFIALLVSSSRKASSGKGSLNSDGHSQIQPMSTKQTTTSQSPQIIEHKKDHNVLMHILCLSQHRTWIMCHGLSWVQWVQMRGDCSFCWYWWNCWPSLFKFSFHNLSQKWRLDGSFSCFGAWTFL